MQGRVLYDVLLYGRGEEEEEGGVLMECDARAALDVLKHLKRFALRSKVLAMSFNNTVEPVDEVVAT